MSHKANDIYNEDKYFDDNPSLTCKCGRKYRQRGWTGKKIYTECMKCHIENFMAQTKNFDKHL